MPIRAGLPLAVCLWLLPAAAPAGPRPEGTVYLLRPAGGADLVATSAALAAAEPDALVLLDSPEATRPLHTFLADWRPSRLVLVAARDGAGDATAQRLGRAPDAVLSPAALLAALFPTAAEVVVCTEDAPADLLQAACLAGVRRAPLFLLDAKALRLSSLLDALARWRTERVVLVGGAKRLLPWLGGWRCTTLDADEAQAAHTRELGRGRGVSTLVLANPFERLDSPEGMAGLAPWLCLQKQAALRFTGPDGEDAAAVVAQTLNEPELRRAEYLILAGSPRAIPPELRPNPLPGDRDRQIEAEPGTPAAEGVASLAVGRLFHSDRAVVPLMLARQHALAHELRGRPPRVLVASNVGGGLPLLEMFSRATVAELTNAGWSVTASVGAADEDELRRQVGRHDVFLWEGHQSTLIRDWQYPRWAEATPPQLVVLQSCLALEEGKVLPLLARGAVGVVGTSTRMYSGSGGAASLCFFDALAHDGQSLGGALRQAKNFLLAYARLKEQRLEATHGGANVRAAWALTLWGDPTFRLAPPAAPRVPALHVAAAGDRLTVTVPAERLPALATPKYRATFAANSRLAGLLRPAEQGGAQELVPLVFAEVPLKPATDGGEPRLTGRGAASRRVLLHDVRRGRGYFLLVPPAEAGAAVHKFRVQWDAPEAPE